jgi:hypothetical protein
LAGAAAGAAAAGAAAGAALALAAACGAANTDAASMQDARKIFFMTQSPFVDGILRMFQL